MPGRVRGGPAGSPRSRVGPAAGGLAGHPAAHTHGHDSAGVSAGFKALHIAERSVRGRRKPCGNAAGPKDRGCRTRRARAHGGTPGGDCTPAGGLVDWRRAVCTDPCATRRAQAAPESMRYGQSRRGRPWRGAPACAGPALPGPTLMVDNGSQYTSREFRSSMATLRIILEYVGVNTPEQNGHIESFHKTSKRRLAARVCGYSRRQRGAAGRIRGLQPPPNPLCPEIYDARRVRRAV